jgi:uncharacterized membrane protein
MNNNIGTAEEFPDSGLLINQITLDHPWQWIAAGWQDIKKAPTISLTYGLLFVISSFLLSGLLLAMGMFFFIPALMAGFFLISPLLAMGLYETSRSLTNQEAPQFLDTFFVWRRTPFNLLVMGLVLMMGFLIWMLLSNVVFALFFFGITPDFENALNVLFFSGDSPAFMGAGILVGSVVALAVFSISVVSVPMIIDRNFDTMSAIAISTRCVLNNPKPLLLWAALIVMFVGIGMFTFFLGLILFMPLVGHASWHAYKDLVTIE